MRNIFTFFGTILASLILLAGCSTAPQDKIIAKIGNTSLYSSDAEFLAAIRSRESRNKASITAELQHIANTRRMAETARILFAGAQTSVQEKVAANEELRLAQIYSYFYLQVNMGHTNKILQDYYEKNKARYADSTDSASSDFTSFVKLREKIAEDLFLEENFELAAQVNDSNRVAILDSCRRAIMNSEPDKLKNLYKVEIITIEPPNAEDYYKNHPEEFQTKTAYKLLSLSDADSSALAGKIKGVSTRENFAKLAKEMPIIKQGHAIMEIGMFPTLDDEISKLGAKKFTPILRAPDTQKYYVFYIDSIIAPQLKPWDRAKNLAKTILESAGDFPLDSSTVLATIGGVSFITEKEVLEEQAKIPPMRRASFRRATIVNILIEKRLYAKAAKEKGLDKSVEYIAWTRQEFDQVYQQVLTDSLLANTLGIPEDSLKAAYEAEKDSLFLPKSYEDSKLDIVVWLSIPDIAYRKEFALNRQNYGQAENWESIKRAAYKKIRYAEFSGIQERVLAKKIIPVAIIDTSWGLEFAPNDFAELAAQARAKYENRDLQKAKTLWERARTLFPQNDSIQKNVSYELANIYQELNMFRNAVDEYNMITKLWSNEQDTYKAYFMQGFVLSEYEKSDSLALIAFEEMLAKFPNSELSDDARTMVENIKSGGKIFEELIKKIEASSEE